MSRRKKTNKNRRGAAIVELAICIPIIALIVYGSIEASSFVFLRQAMVQASYEGIKVAADPDATTENARNAAMQVADARGFEDVTVEFEPSNIEDLERGTVITIIVSAPGNANTAFPFEMFNNRSVSASATMVKE